MEPVQKDRKPWIDGPSILSPLFHHSSTPASIVAQRISVAPTSNAPAGMLSILHPFIPPASLPLPAAAIHSIDTRTLLVGLLAVAIAYLLTVRHLRFRAIRTLERKYGSTEEDFGDLDYKEAQKILVNLFMLEAPWLFLTAKDFAFLRVCPLPRSSWI